ncbi:MAG: HDOD domain-containing protein [Congregibacter sp.]
MKDATGFKKPIVPDISPGVVRLLALLSSEDAGVVDVAEELKLYPVVAARLIGLANSAWSSPVNPVLSLSDACSRLGLGVVRSTAIAYSVSAPFNTMRCPPFDPLRFWCGSLLASEAARLLADVNRVDAAVASTAGMLKNLGLLWLTDIEPQLTEAALNEAKDTGTPLAMLLTGAVGMTHSEATVHLLDAWNFSDELREACLPDSHNPIAQTVSKASELADNIYFELEGMPEKALDAASDNELTQLQERLRKGLARTLELAKTIAA